MSGKPDIYVALLCAEDDDHHLVGVVHLCRMHALEPEVIPGVDVSDAPLIRAVKHKGAGLYALFRSDNLTGQRLREIKKVFAQHDAPGHDLLALRLDPDKPDDMMDIIARRIEQSRGVKLVKREPEPGEWSGARPLPTAPSPVSGVKPLPSNPSVAAAPRPAIDYSAMDKLAMDDSDEVDTGTFRPDDSPRPLPKAPRLDPFEGFKPASSTALPVPSTSASTPNKTSGGQWAVLTAVVIAAVVGVAWVSGFFSPSPDRPTTGSIAKRVSAEVPADEEPQPQAQPGAPARVERKAGPKPNAAAAAAVPSADALPSVTDDPPTPEADAPEPAARTGRTGTRRNPGRRTPTPQPPQTDDGGTEPPPPVEPPPPTTTDPSGLKPLPKKQPEPAAAPDPPDACTTHRNAGLAARKAHSWKKLLGNLDKGECWTDAFKRQELRTLALMELGKHAQCVSMGTGHPSSKVRGWVELCQAKLAQAKD